MAYIKHTTAAQEPETCQHYWVIRLFSNTFINDWLAYFAFSYERRPLFFLSVVLWNMSFFYKVNALLSSLW